MGPSAKGDGDAARVPCTHCGHPALNFCELCGQKVLKGRPGLRDLVVASLEQWTSLDRGFLHTLIALTVRPGITIREYLRGHTAPYTHPIRYLIILVAIGTAATIGFDVLEISSMSDAIAAESTENAAGMASIAEVYITYFNVFVIAVVPLLALSSMLLFRKARLNFTEHLIFNTFAYAHENLIYIALLPLFLLIGPVAAGAVYFSLVLSYYAWVCFQFFGGGVVRTGLKSVAINALAYVAYYSIILSALVAWGIMSRWSQAAG